MSTDSYTSDNLQQLIKKMTEEYSSAGHPAARWDMLGTIDKDNAGNNFIRDRSVKVHIFIVGQSLEVLRSVASSTQVRKKALEVAQRELFWSEPAIEQRFNIPHTIWQNGERLVLDGITQPKIRPGKTNTYVMQLEFKVASMN